MPPLFRKNLKAPEYRTGFIGKFGIRVEGGVMVKGYYRITRPEGGNI